MQDRTFQREVDETRKNATGASKEVPRPLSARLRPFSPPFFPVAEIQAQLRIRRTLQPRTLRWTALELQNQMPMSKKAPGLPTGEAVYGDVMRKLQEVARVLPCQLQLEFSWQQAKLLSLRVAATFAFSCPEEVNR